MKSLVRNIWNACLFLFGMNKNLKFFVVCNAKFWCIYKVLFSLENQKIPKTTKRIQRGEKDTKRFHVKRLEPMLKESEQTNEEVYPAKNIVLFQTKAIIKKKKGLNAN